MKKNLIVCNTTYQLLVALNIQKECLKEDETDIILTDRTDFTETKNRLEAERVFKRVFMICPKQEEGKKSWIKRRFAHYFWAIECVGNTFEKRYDINLERYDCFWACNMTDPIVLQLYTLLKKKNKNLICVEFEEGYGSYVRPLRYKEFPNKRIEWEYKLLGMDFMLEEKIDYVYLYFPELYPKKDTIIKQSLKLMNYKDTEIRKSIQNIFGCAERSYINKKYIILEESFKVDGIVNNAEELFTYIVDKVGNENVMLKTHPRNGRNSYHQRKIQVIDVPVAWEALIATEDMDDKIIITCSSGSAVNTKLLYNSRCRIIFLNRMLIGGQNNTLQEPDALEYLNRFQKKYSGEVFFPESYEELDKILV